MFAIINIMIFIALLAIIVPLVTVVVLRLPARIGMSISAVVVTLAAVLFWQMTGLAVAASVAQAVHRALSILLILFGAILLLKTLEKTGSLAAIKQSFHTISPDMRVQAVLVAFAFVSLMEGISGFGTPAVVAAPILLALGFPPLAAAALALLGDTVGCTFGAVGTPLIVGLENVSLYSENLTWLVGAQVAMFDLLIGTLLPLGLTSLLIFSFGNQTRRGKWYALRQIAPWALLVGMTYSVSAFLIVRLIGPEFTAIIAGALALLVGIVTAKRNIWIPQQTWQLSNTANTTEKPASKLPLWRAWLPYGIVIGLLLLTRTVPTLKQFANSILNASWHGIFGIDSISSSWGMLYSPGTILIIGALVAASLHKKPFTTLRKASLDAAATVIGAMTALVPTLVMVQVFTNSGVNTSGLTAMPIFIGHELAAMFGSIWTVCAPLLGSIGAFIAGSATVSTLTLGPVQESIAGSTGLPIIIVLALHMVGAAAGNIIAIHNVVAVSTVAGLKHKEGYIMRKLIVPMMVYVGVAAMIGLVVCFV